MKWVVCAWRHDARRRRPRAIAWHPPHNRGVIVRHCGHPTANYPYWIELYGIDQLETAGTFRLLAQAQMRALALADCNPPSTPPSP